MIYEKNSELKDVCKNMDKLVEVLNHRMTMLEGHVNIIKTDIQWMKRFGWVGIGLLASIFVTMVGIVLQ